MAAILTSSKLSAVFQTIETRFRDAYKQVATFQDKFAWQTTSTSDKKLYVWSDLLPAMRTWPSGSPRVYHNPAAHAYELQNKKFELSAEIDADTLEDETVDLFDGTPEMFAMQAAKKPDIEVAAAMETASPNLFDGVPFFSASHPIDPVNPTSGTQSNALSLALTAPNLDTALATARGFKGRDGFPLGGFQGRIGLVVPLALAYTAAQLLNTTIIAPSAAWGAVSTSTSDNVLRGIADLIVNPYLTSATGWYLADLSGPVRGMIWQSRYQARFTAMTDPSDEAVFDRDVFRWGIKTRGTAGYGPWFLMLRGNT